MYMGIDILMSMHYCMTVVHLSEYIDVYFIEESLN